MYYWNVQCIQFLVASKSIVAFVFVRLTSNHLEGHKCRRFERLSDALLINLVIRCTKAPVHYLQSVNSRFHRFCWDSFFPPANFSTPVERMCGMRHTNHTASARENTKSRTTNIQNCRRKFNSLRCISVAGNWK